MMLSRTTARVAIRHYSRSAVARAEPKMHKATENWDALMSKRPVDPDDLHVSCSLLSFGFVCCDVKFRIPSNMFRTAHSCDFAEGLPPSL